MLEQDHHTTDKYFDQYIWPAQSSGFSPYFFRYRNRQLKNQTNSLSEIAVLYIIYSHSPTLQIKDLLDICNDKPAKVLRLIKSLQKRGYLRLLPYSNFGPPNNPILSQEEAEKLFNMGVDHE